MCALCPVRGHQVSVHKTETENAGRKKCWSGSYNILMQEFSGASDKSSHTSTSKTWHLQARSSCKDLLVRISREGLYQDPHKIFWQGPAQDHAEHFQKLSARPLREDLDRRPTRASQKDLYKSRKDTKRIDLLGRPR